ncbi:methylated-DNA--[protein]-cysteine S-methyltransferase [Sporosarcina sp. GW1-11]|uniref:methylated-DNA--[protein]-cysteine S-methyltransferase n=1 Tax=Sporosarcina sp. GW1-11 TaxID=2899126 RepID=UPI00294C4DA5|nr:methylated-DNA--[protein]-cysteine S-methyltransferase [Sporosarcina sp. GW1-11]MDV6378349.1 methylated-DNA--[protein]-cysteine S-methyltransferase [Sporosarcina sp. GW1-11]
MYWTKFQFVKWQVTLAATEQGLCYVGLSDSSEQYLTDWCYEKFVKVEIVENASELATYANEIAKYLSGVQTDFKDIRMDQQGTPFQLEVWNALQEIPYGDTVSYSIIANKIGKRSAVRAVASAIGKNPLLLVIPCHRVVGKDGSLSGYRDGKEIKEQLLQLENSSKIIG